MPPRCPGQLRCGHPVLDRGGPPVACAARTAHVRACGRVPRAPPHHALDRLRHCTPPAPVNCGVATPYLTGADPLSLAQTRISFFFTANFDPQILSRNRKFRRNFDTLFEDLHGTVKFAPHKLGPTGLLLAACLACATVRSQCRLIGCSRVVSRLLGTVCGSSGGHLVRTHWSWHVCGVV